MKIQVIELEELVEKAFEGDEEAFREIARRVEEGDKEAISAREKVASKVSTYDCVEGNFPWA